MIRQTEKYLKKRLIASLCFLVPLMYVSMGHMIGLPLGSVFHGGGWHAILYAGTQLVLTLPVCWINRAFFLSGWKGIKTRAPGMDTLVALGAGASLAYGVFAIVMICIGLSTGNDDLVMQYRHDLYFESAAMILTLITVGKTLEAYSKGKTTDALKSLMKLAPQTACVLRGGEQVTVPVSEVNVGDLFLVRPGESIPVDGTVTEGISTVNEAALTGESMPVDKFPGSPVSAATINQNGALTCRAERVGQDTTLSQVIRLVRDAAATKAPLAKTADRVSGIFVPTVICIAAATFVIWLLLGQTFTFALARGISVLVISCPCALGLATPVAIMVGSGVGAKNGILFKTAASLETTGYTDAVLLDKTGTVTTGEPNVVKICGTRNVPEKFLLSMAAGLELRSEHPLARAILQRAEKDHLSYATVTDFEAVPGKGLRGKVAGKVIAGGNADFIRETCAVATAKGVPMDADEFIAHDHKDIVTNIADYYPSMCQDMLFNHRQTEIDVLNGKIAEYGEQLGIEDMRIDADDLEQLITHIVEQAVARLLKLLVAAHVLDAMELVEQVAMNAGIGQQRLGMLGLRILMRVDAHVVMDKLACCIGEFGVRRKVGALQVGGDVDARIH